MTKPHRGNTLSPWHIFIPLPLPFLCAFALSYLLGTPLKLLFFLGTATIGILVYFTKRSMRSVYLLSLAAGFLLAWIRCDLLYSVPGIDQALHGLFSPVRQALGTALAGRVGGVEGDLCRALLLGITDGLSQDMYQTFSALGITHILALSGMHLSVLCGSLHSLLCLCGIKRTRALCFSGAFALGFCALCGFPFSLTRSMLMYVLFCMAQLSGKDASSLSSLCLSGCVICVFCPSAITSLSFQMSFLATAGLLCLATPMAEQCVKAFRHPIPRAAASLLASLGITSFCANLFLFPIYILRLGSFAPAGLLLNLIFIPITNILLYCLPFVLLLYPISPLCHGIAWLCKQLASLFLHLSEVFGNSALGKVYPLDAPFVGALSVALLFGSLAYCAKKGRPGLGLLLIFTLVGILYFVCTWLCA